jgi:hypothetical protein
MKETRLQRQAPVEERRAQYEVLAECLITMTRLETQTVGGSPLQVADEMDERPDKPGFVEAILAHVTALTTNLDWYDARTIRKFYVAMRLHDDELRTERQQAYAKAWAADPALQGGAQ